MRKSLSYIAAICLLTLSAGCSSDEFGNMAEGQGKLVLTPKISTEVSEVVVSRATDNKALLDKLNLALKNSRGETLHYWNDVTGIPWDKTGTSIVHTLNAGTYTIEGWTGNDTPTASFEADDRYFKGEQKFEIITGGETDVTLTCKIANTAVAVEYDRVDEVLKDYKIVVSSSSTFLTFGQSETRTGYFLLPADNKNLEYTITGTKNDGGQYSRTETITNAKPATKYTIKVSYSDPEPTGGSSITVSIDETALIEEPHTVTFRTRPEIKVASNDGDIELGENNPFSRATGDVGDLSIIVSSSGSLNSVSIDMLGLGELTGISSDKISFLDPDTNFDVLTTAGITVTSGVDEDKETSYYTINLSKDFTEKISEGEYLINIDAQDSEYNTTDTDIKSNSAVFRLVVSNDGAVIEAMSSDDKDNIVTPTSLTFKGSVVKDDVEEVGFYYRKVNENNDEEWQYIAADPVSRTITLGSEFVKTVSGLQQGATYEYAAAFNQKRGLATVKQTTPNPQLPNAGFEEWQPESSPNLIYAKGGEMFWDSGNHGSATMSKNVTTPVTSIKHSGNYSAMLKSQFVGVMGIGKFAAGNIFIGQYLKTDGTDGVLGWGRKFEGLKYYPKQLKGYVKYTPATVGKYTNNNAPDIVNGKLDKGIIYIALLNDDCNVQGNGTFPVEVRTKDAHLFDKTASNVIAYGELVFDKATEGSGMIEFTIDLDYKSDVIPTYIMITASASKGGDYFAGADGSVMYLDDLELVY